MTDQRRRLMYLPDPSRWDFSDPQTGDRPGCIGIRHPDGLVAHFLEDADEIAEQIRLMQPGYGLILTVAPPSPRPKLEKPPPTPPPIPPKERNYL